MNEVPPVRRRFAMLHSAWDFLLSYALKFGIVGLVVYFVDFAIFNLLVVAGTSFGANGFIFTTLGASLTSTSIAIVLNWLGNRYWTFRSMRRKDVWREFGEYLVVALGGLGITLLTVWVSHDLLGHKSLFADNVAKNLLGQTLATLFRFSLYRFWVYGHHRNESIAGASGETEFGEMALFVEPGKSRE